MSTASDVFPGGLSRAPHAQDVDVATRVPDCADTPLEELGEAAVAALARLLPCGGTPAVTFQSSI
ncbi:hypothetical protein ACFU6S_39115 [Streptomyces sp. NPDC057456]|uniref:hypothetical protein n=1 Tax=Streptomyces sp. NPDC057456 TaxID=3346139 RepID=UPI0036AA920D